MVRAHWSGELSGSGLGAVEEQTVLSILCCFSGLPWMSPRNAASEWSLTFMLSFDFLTSDDPSEYMGSQASSDKTL